MKKIIFALLISSIVLGACNATPEKELDEALPVIAQPSSVKKTVDSSQSESANKNVVDSSDNSSTELTENKSSETSDSVTKNSPDNTSEEASKTEEKTSTPSDSNALTELKNGTFKNAAHKVSGNAKLIKIGEQHYLRLEDFETENGPGLHMYLVKNVTGTPDGNDFLDLGSLKSTKGNQNYEIPPDTDIDSYKSVSVWCQPFGVNFGFAQFN